MQPPNANLRRSRGAAAIGSPALKRLDLLRHAKSSWDDPGLADHDRPLAPRGRRAAGLIAEHVRREGIAPALVLCSSARRALETLEGIARAFDGEVPIEVERDLYGASQRELLERLRRIPDATPSVMLIGHNPAIHALALSLAGNGPDFETLALKYPTGALATLTLEGSWEALGPGGAKLAAFVRPKDLR
jgi:phosphohistidine phosphatase